MPIYMHYLLVYFISIFSHFLYRITRSMRRRLHAESVIFRLSNFNPTSRFKDGTYRCKLRTAARFDCAGNPAPRADRISTAMSTAAVAIQEFRIAPVRTHLILSWWAMMTFWSRNTIRYPCCNVHTRWRPTVTVFLVVGIYLTIRNKTDHSFDEK